MKKINVLLIGSGGREHAMATFLAKSPILGSLVIAPGNPGTQFVGENVTSPGENVSDWLPLLKERNIDLVVIGPEKPLVDGWADYFRENGYAVFGPSASAARLEGSKSFSKEFMSRHNIPTASYQTFTTEMLTDILPWVQTHNRYPVVLKVDGLAGGKGVFICESLDDVSETLGRFQEEQFQNAAKRIVVEEFMEGEELSVFVITDGTNYKTLQHAQDHKKIGEGDTGLNTGGMGAYAPVPFIDGVMMKTIEEKIIKPTLQGMKAEGNPYSGILYAGLMLTSEGPKVVEYNCRFGDPECQVILPTLESDLLTLMWDTAGGRLDLHQIRRKNLSCTCVVMASEGYPESYQTGYEISGLEEETGGFQEVQKDVTKKEVSEHYVFHAGTQISGESIVTAGGRVLGVVGTGSTLKESIQSAYKRVEKIHFENAYYRNDIGKKGLPENRA